MLSGGAAREEREINVISLKGSLHCTNEKDSKSSRTMYRIHAGRILMQTLHMME